MFAGLLLCLHIGQLANIREADPLSAMFASNLPDYFLFGFSVVGSFIFGYSVGVLAQDVAQEHF